jgi:hypothetical protein
MGGRGDTTWGLGLEHEMLFGVDGRRPGVTYVLPSQHIVNALVMGRLEPIFVALERVLQTPMRRPVQEATVVLTGNRKAARQQSYSTAAAAAVKRALAHVPVRDLRTFVCCVFPAVGEPVYGWCMRLWAGVWSLQDEMEAKEHELHAAKGRLFAAAAGKQSSATATVNKLASGVLCSLVAHLVLGSEASQQFDTTLGSVVDAALSKSPDQQRRPAVGDTLHCASVPWEGRGRQAGKGSGRKLSGGELVETVLGVTLFPYPGKGDDGRAIELDGDFVEVKSTRFSKARVEDVVAQVRQHEATVLAAALRIDASARILPHSGYSNIWQVLPHRRATSGRRQQGKSGYAGSYHVWFTLPHLPDAAASSFVNQHVAFANCLQWLEPLLLSCTSGDPRALGLGATFPRANMRGVFNALSGIGTTDVCGTMPLREGHDAVMAFYTNERDFAAAVAAGDPFQAPRRTSGRYRMSYTVDGKTALPYSGCRQIERRTWVYGSQADYPFPVSGVEESTQASSLINRVLAHRHGAGFTMQQGNDLRVPWCGNFEMQLLPGWSAHAVADGPGRFVLRFAHRANRTWSAKAPLAKKAPTPSKVGFEFRLMDNMPSSAMRQLLRLFVLVAAASTAAASGECRNPSADEDWATAAADVLVMGRFAPCHAAYVRKLRARLSLPPPPPGQTDVRGALLAVCAELHGRHARHPWVALLTKGHAKPPVPEDCNMAGWADAFALKRGALDAAALAASAATEPDAGRWAADVLQSGRLPDAWRHDLPFMHATLLAEGHR